MQALGLSFTISSLALAVNLASVAALNLSLGPASVGALAVAWSACGSAKCCGCGCSRRPSGCAS